MHSEKLIGMAHVKPGEEVVAQGVELSPPEVFPILGVGMVIAHQPMDDGTVQIALLGQARCRIIKEVKQLPYRVAAVTAIAEPENNSFAAKKAAAVEREHLMVQAGQLIEHTAAGEARDQLKKSLQQKDEPGTLADLLANVYVQDARVRQLLLECVEPNARARILQVSLQKLLDKVAPGKEVPEFYYAAMNMN
jgi:Lon protease-like protein